MANVIIEITVVARTPEGRKQSYTFSTNTMPRHWKSWVMRQCPYGTNFEGATFFRSRIAS